MLRKLVLRAGPDGKPKILAKGKGGSLELPALPLVGLPVRVQLVSAAGECWEASYGMTLRNDSERLKAKSD